MEIKEIMSLVTLNQELEIFQYTRRLNGMKWTDSIQQFWKVLSFYLEITTDPHNFTKLFSPACYLPHWLSILTLHCSIFSRQIQQIFCFHAFFFIKDIHVTRSLFGIICNNKCFEIHCCCCFFLIYHITTNFDVINQITNNSEFR